MISNLTSLKQYLSRLNQPVIGIGVTAFNRLGLENIWPNYHLIAIGPSSEDKYIKKSLKITYCSKKISEVRENTASLLKDKKIAKVLKKTQANTGLLIYRPSRLIEAIAKKQGWLILANPSSLSLDQLENKVVFREILANCQIEPIPGETKTFSKLCFDELIAKYGPKFVLQIPNKGGGKGTFFIDKQTDFNKFINCPNHQSYKNQKIVVAKFINGYSPSITGCVTKQAVFFTHPQLQILDVKECSNPTKGSSLFCGTDFTLSRDLSQTIVNQSFKLADIIAKHLQTMGYLGIFGLDLLVDKKTNKVYVVECNPRLLGTFPAFTMAQKLNQEVPFMALHSLAFLKADYKIDYKLVSASHRQPKIGSQLILSSQIMGQAKIGRLIKAGIYSLKNSQLKFLRPGFDLKHLKNAAEFLIVDGVPKSKIVLRPGERLFRILTLDSVLTSDFKTLKKSYRRLVKLVYRTLAIRPV